MIFGTHQENTIEQFNDIASRAAKAALMADGHLGYIMPVGGVAAYWDHVSVAGVGVDIACGNCAIKTDIHVDDFGGRSGRTLETIADDIFKTISFGVGRNNLSKDAPTDHPLFESEDWFRLRERAGHGMTRELKDKARNQLGTVGTGNHYVDVFSDEYGYLWVGVHFGSRGFGFGIAEGFKAIGTGNIWGDKVKDSEVLLSMSSSMGQDYWSLMQLAGKYAYVGREWVTRKVVKDILKAKEVDMVHNHHNFAWKEKHFIEGDLHDVYVVRKGATPAFPGQRGFVGGSMGDNAVILKGTDIWDYPINEYPNQQKLISELQQEALYSTVHGAGRVMSRSEAKGKTNRKTGELKLNEDGTPVRAPKITKDMQQKWLQKKGVILRGGDVDEAPQAYRRLPDVLAAQGDTITVLHTLKPLIVVMAGADVFDPYKD